MSSRTIRLAGLVLVPILACSPQEATEYLDLVASFGRASLQESEEGLPRTDVGAGLLFLPAGSAVTYSFEGQRKSRLEFEGMTIRGGASRLTVTLSSDAETAFFESAVDRDEKQRSMDLPFRVSRGRAPAISLTLRAESSSPDPGDGVLLTRPVILGHTAEKSDGALPAAIERDAGRPPDVIVYLIDTLRRDRLGTYGYERSISPNIDEFAGSATVFENSIGQASWTKPSVASTFTGFWPPNHETFHWNHRLPQRLETMAERLSSAGYQTAAFITNTNASRSFGFDQGFEHFWIKKKHRSDLVNDLVLAWLEEERDESRPLFLYVHTMDPHADYAPEEPYRSRLAPRADEMEKWQPQWRWPNKYLPIFRDLYDAEIAQNDAAFGELTAALREWGLFDPALIFVLSDHGEEFLEHGGWRHGRVLHHGSLDVPIIVKFPGQTAARRSAVPASHVDVLPTILDVAGLAGAGSLDGQSLTRPVERPVFSHLQLGPAGQPIDTATLQVSVVDGGWKLIQVHGEEAGTQLFDLQQDPGEAEDVAARYPVRRALLEGLLRERLARAQTVEAEEIELTDELTEALRDLGYLQ